MIELLLPARLGRNFRWLFASSSVSNVADGIMLAAGPLLVASVTRDPFAVAMAVFLQQLPWLLFGVAAGALIDRVDRRLLTVTVDLCRATVLGLLALSVATGVVEVWIVLLAMFLLGTAETFADNASSTLVATAVPKEHLGVANSRFFGVAILGNQLAGPPIGAFLFATGSAIPFGVNAVCFLLAAVLISRLRLPATVREPSGRSMRHDVAEGMRWLWGHAPVRTLALTLTAFNVTFGAAFSVYVLYAHERLGLGEVGFGLLMTVGALGSLVGTTAYQWLEQRFSMAQLMRIGLVVETITHLVLALTSTAWVAGLMMAIFGVHAMVWGSTSTTVRQRAVPEHLLGRVTSVYLIGSVGGLALGSLIGGAIAQQWGVLAPFWFGFVGSIILTVTMWRSFAQIAHAAEVGPAESAALDEKPV
ncbi:MAG: MFS transporter [Nocardioides sp.]